MKSRNDDTRQARRTVQLPSEVFQRIALQATTRALAARQLESGAPATGRRAVAELELEAMQEALASALPTTKIE